MSDTLVKRGMSSARLQIHIDVHEPIELVELTLSLQALAYEYRRFFSERMRQKGHSVSASDREDIKLYITKIQSNCIFAELGSAVSVMGSLFALAEYLNIFIDFTKNIGAAITYFRGLAKQSEIDPADIPYNKGQCDRLADVLKTVSRNKNGALNISAVEYRDHSPDATIHLTIRATDEEAYEARKGALLAKEALEARGDADYPNVLMFFQQTNTDDPKSAGRTGDRAVIRSISEKPLPVHFVSEIDQQKITYAKHDPATNPLKCSYRVDVNVETDRNNVPRFYRVVRVHEVLPPADDEDPQSELDL